jgi:Peroxidase, family 2
MEVYGLSGPFATVLAGGGVIKCGNGFRLNLEDLAAHNKIEHDGSMVGLAPPAFFQANI